MILAAGAIGSPQLLMLSGIGDPDELAAAASSGRSSSPGVGREPPGPSLRRRHLGVGRSAIRCSTREKPGGGAEFLLRRRGPLTSTVCEAFLFTRSDGGEGPPDLQFHLAPAYFADNGFEEYDGTPSRSGPVLVAPRSRGRATAAQLADPAAKPAISATT